MRTETSRWILWLLVIPMILSACREEDNFSTELVGEWRVYERGYSPGAGYIVEEVSPEPPMLMRFYKNGLFSSNYAEFENFTVYELVEEDADLSVLTLNGKNADESNYSVVIAGDTAVLSYRYCFEGCHVGIIRR